MAHTRRDRRQQNRHQRSGILLGIAAALVAFLLVYQVFLKGDDTSTATSVTPGAPAAAVSDTTTTLAPLEPELPNGSFDELSLRDPFEPVGGVTPSDDGGETSTTTSTTTASTATIATTATTTPAQDPTTGTEVALLDVTEVNGVLTARVRVGTSEYTVTAGQTFATNYQLVVFTSATCANFMYASSPFSLCTGEQVIK